jgi:hypothetical protein
LSHFNKEQVVRQRRGAIPSHSEIKRKLKLKKKKRKKRRSQGVDGQITVANEPLL